MVFDGRRSTSCVSLPALLLEGSKKPQLLALPSVTSLESVSADHGRLAIYRSWYTGIPQSLAIETLIELACRAQKDVDWRLMYKLLRRQLADMGILPPPVQQLQPLRSMYQQVFSRLLVSAQLAAVTSARGDAALLQSPSGRPSWCAGSLDGSVLLSRYRCEFDELDVLGRGGFAVVCRCRSRVDLQLYAIKRVMFGLTSSRLAETAVREVSVLASLSHPNVVRYHTAWLEPLVQWHRNTLSRSDHRTPSSGPPSVRFAEASVSPATPLESVSNSLVSCLDRGSFGCDITSSVKLTSCSRVAGRFWTDGPSSSGSSVGFSNTGDVRRCISGSGVKDTKLSSVKPARSESVTLYIQMQLCERSLRRWLLVRNSTLQLPPSATETTLSPRLDLVEPRMCLRIMRDILLGVSYIHRNELIHRDLKPDNVFLTFEGRAMLGDFGLARSLTNICAHRASSFWALVNPTLPSSGLRDTGPSAFSDTWHSMTASAEPVDRVSSSCSSREPRNSERCRSPCSEPLTSTGEWTVGVGTATYAAPEQASGNSYGSSADLFSVGLILLELFQPFFTDWERFETLSRLRRRRVVDAQVQRRWPWLVKVVVDLSDPVPSRRPTADQLLQNPLFSDPGGHAVDGRVDVTASSSTVRANGNAGDVVRGTSPAIPRDSAHRPPSRSAGSTGILRERFRCRSPTGCSCGEANRRQRSLLKRARARCTVLLRRLARSRREAQQLRLQLAAQRLDQTER